VLHIYHKIISDRTHSFLKSFGFDKLIIVFYPGGLVGKFTAASFTPSVVFKIDSTLTAQAAHDISRTGNVSFFVFVF
jgi:hypothetical protein